MKLALRLFLIVALALGLLATVREAFVSSPSAQVAPPRLRGPSRENTDPPAPTPVTQAGIALIMGSVSYGASSTRVVVHVRNRSPFPFMFESASTTAVWNGREYENLAPPKGLDAAALLDDVQPGRTTSAVFTFPWTDTTPGLRILMHGVSGSRSVGRDGRLDWEIDVPGVTR